MTLAVLTLVELTYQSRKQYLLALESFVAIILLSSNSNVFSSMQTRHVRIIISFIFFVCSVTSIVFLGGNRRAPLQIANHHPIEELIRTSRAQFSEVLAKQSLTLDEAIREYKARYGMHPPPKFDRWFAFAQANNVQMIDEYNTIFDLLKPFWGLPPSTIRRNARGALGVQGTPYAAFRILNGQIIRTLNGGWFAEPLTELLQVFAHHLPAMDLVFNYLDEPSVVVPNDLLAQLVSQPLPMKENPRNSFSERPSDFVDEIQPFYGPDVLSIGRQTVWSQLIQSCPLESPVRNITGGTDATISYARDPLGFIYNTTALTNVCNQPSLPSHHGFFDRPDTLNLCSTLTPIFSVSKPSTFNDILFPSPWYYSDHVSLDESRDMDWHLKQNQLHWRGGTTSGYAIDYGWRRHHRQRLVAAFDKIEKPVKVLKKIEGDVWIEDAMSTVDAQALFDVKFTSVSESSTDEARLAQTIEFDIAPEEDQQDLRKWKYLLDVDGHGLSGRFYALLKSNSLVFKCTMFREWHDEWLRPWVHYIPLGLYGSDWFEAVRFFAVEDKGQLEAQRIATESRVWSKKVLRKEDMEAWMFRLLLEYFHCATPL